MLRSDDLPGRDASVTVGRSSASLRAALVCSCVALTLPSPGSGQPATWTLERTDTIGDALDSDASLTLVGSVIVDANRLLVAQPFDNGVRIFSLEREFLGFIGREGEGPGEFRRVGGMGSHDGLVWVADPTLGRVQFFDAENRVVSSVRIRGHPTLPVGRPGTRAVFPDGSMLVRHSRATSDLVDFPERPEYLVRFDPEGLPLDTVSVLTGRATEVRFPTGRGITSYMGLPESYRSLYASAADGSGIVVVHRGEATGGEPHAYRVIRFEGGADTAWVRDFRYDPIPVSDAWRSRHLEVDARGENARARRILEQAYDALRFFPPVDDVKVGADGSTWLLVRTGVDSFEWEVLDASGRRLARIAPPPQGRLRWAGTNSLWFVEHDELDIPYLVRYEIHRRPTGR